MPETISTGVLFVDELLQGGYERDVITTLYGPSSSGKTNLCLLAAAAMARQRKTVLVIDTEGGIAIERLKQIAPDYQQLLERLNFFTPTTFEEQCLAVESVKNALSEETGLIIVDTISMLYRLVLGQTDQIADVNSALGKQIATLTEITRKKHIPVLLVSQVYADFDNRENIKMVGGDILKYGSKCLIELRKRDDGLREFILRKHRFLPEGITVQFRIVQQGIEQVVKESKF